MSLGSAVTGLWLGTFADLSSSLNQAVVFTYLDRLYIYINTCCKMSPIRAVLSSYLPFTPYPVSKLIFEFTVDIYG